MPTRREESGHAEVKAIPERRRPPAVAIVGSSKCNDGNMLELRDQRSAILAGAGLTNVRAPKEAGDKLEVVLPRAAGTIVVLVPRSCRQEEASGSLPLHKLPAC